MATRKKATETRVKAAVGRERRIVLALRALLDSLKDLPLDPSADHGVAISAEMLEGVTTAEQSALTTLNELGYGELESIPSRVAKLNEQLKIAVEAGDGNTIAELGKELARAKAGLPPSKMKVAADA